MGTLNQSAQLVCESLERRAAQLQIERHAVGGATVWDFGVATRGGLEAGRVLAEICLASLAEVQLESIGSPAGTTLGVAVRTDHPVEACLGAQYAGWQIAAGKFFAMGSGPMRTLTGKETVIGELQLDEQSEVAVGVLESGRLPTEDVCRQIAADCGVPAERLTLCVARTGSLAGTVQIVARTVETALHKLHSLGFDLHQVRAGWGTAPITPPTADDFQALGWTNDAVLYAGQVVLWVDSADSELQEIVAKVPSDASRDYGRPFGDIFRSYNCDFYQIDPLLFSPAAVTMINVRTGSVHRAGKLAWDILQRSLAGPAANPPGAEPPAA
ncbi:MAG: methenyltetrahydromethanopterin cyclohydrolase [Pirellulales bacterium]